MNLFISHKFLRSSRTTVGSSKLETRHSSTSFRTSTTRWFRRRVAPSVVLRKFHADVDVAVDVRFGNKFGRSNFQECSVFLLRRIGTFDAGDDDRVISKDKGGDDDEDDDGDDDDDDDDKMIRIREVMMMMMMMMMMMVVVVVMVTIVIRIDRMQILNLHVRLLISTNDHCFCTRRIEF